MASDRASYTTEDVLELLHDVETTIREGDWHFAASVGMRSAQYDIAPAEPAGDEQHPRIRLPQHSSRAPIPPITGSREEWPPRHSNVFQTTSTGHPEHPRVRLPPYAPRIQTLPVMDSREGWSSPASSIERAHGRLSQDLESYSLPLPWDQLTFDSQKGQVKFWNHEADNPDLSEMVHGETLSKIAICEQGDTAETASVGAGGDKLINASQNEAVIASATEGRRLYIGNLAYATTEEDLKDFFKGYLVYVDHPHIPRLRVKTNITILRSMITCIPINPHTTRPVGYAFVDVSTSSEADRAIQELNGQSILDRKVSVQSARKPPNTAQTFHTEDMEIDHGRFTLAEYQTWVTPNNTRNKRERAAGLWDDDDDEQQRHANKRVKLVSGTSTPATPTRQEIVTNTFSEPPYQSCLLDWKDFRMGSPSPMPTSCHAKLESRTLDIQGLGLSSEDSSMLYPDHMDIDSPATLISSQRVSSTSEEVARGRSAEARKWKDRNLPSHGTLQVAGDLRSPLRSSRSSTFEEAARCRSAEARKWKDRNLPSHGTPQTAGDLRSPLMFVPRRGIDKDSGLPTRPVGLSDLPDDLLDRIFTILLKSEDDEITLSTSWLMTFVNSIAGAPSVLQLNSRLPSTLKPASVLRSDLRRINASLKDIPNNKWPRDPERSQTGILTRSLLTVSTSFHDRAARIFYGSNTFNFTHQKTCWIHLESFLATIGSKNASHIRHICIRAPIWHPGVRRDAIIGALFDAMAPVTRLAAFKVPADDRLLSAITNCANALGESGNLKSLRIDVVSKDNVLHFINRSQDGRYPILADEAAHHEQRRDAGCRALKHWASESFGPSNKPALVTHSINHVTLLEASRFRKMLAPMIREAGEYGWIVDQRLREPNKPGKNVFRRHRT